MRTRCVKVGLVALTFGCGTPARSVDGGGTTCARAGDGGACSDAGEAFGECTDGAGDDDDARGEQGAACDTAAECRPACCLCPHGQTQYAFSACVRGTCASICDPANDYRAPVCLDGGEAVVAGCLRCDQIVNEALAEGDELGTMVCPGTAAAAWDALSACVVTSCGAVCPGGVMPTNACVQCLDDVDADGGCATEMAGCVAN